MGSLPLITIGITSYNAVSSIERAILSGVNQSWKNIEIIVVDDCSNDGTIDLLNKLNVKYQLLKIFENSENYGVAFSRNKIIKEAEGEFIAFFDDDDESDYNRVEQQFNRIKEYENDFAKGDLVICHCTRMQIYPNGDKHIEQTIGMSEGALVPNGEDVARQILTGKPLADGNRGSSATCSQMARKSTYEAVGGFDNSFRRCEDTELNIRLALSGCHFVGISSPLVTQTMTKTSDKSLEDEFNFTLNVLKKHKDYINSVSIYSPCCRWIDIKYTYLSGGKISFIFKIGQLFLIHPVFVLKRLCWALPNINFNNTHSRFYNEK